MKSVGYIIWFGGYNRKLGKPNDCGYIKSQEYGELYFNQRKILCQPKELTSNTWVCFELIGNGKQISIVNVELLIREAVQNISNSSVALAAHSLLAMDSKNRDVFYISLPAIHATSLKSYIIENYNFSFEKALQYTEMMITEVRLKKRDAEALLSQVEFYCDLFKFHENQIASYNFGLSLPPSIFCNNRLVDKLTPKVVLRLLARYDERIKKKYIDVIKYCIHQLIINLNDKIEPISVYSKVLSIINAWPSMIFYDSKIVASLQKLFLITGEKKILKILPPQVRCNDDVVNCLIQSLKDNGDVQAAMLLPEHIRTREDVVDSLIEILQTTGDDRIIQLIPAGLRNSKKVIDYLVKTLKTSGDRRLLNLIPENLHYSKEVYPFLSSSKQAEYLLNLSLERFKPYWGLSTDNCKKEYLMSKVKLGEHIPDIIFCGDDSIHAALYQLSKARSLQFFEVLHRRIQDFVIMQAWDITPINLDWLLPECDKGIVTYCEGKLWPCDKAPHRVYCPRTKRSCNSERVWPQMDLPIRKWSITEILSYFNIQPRLSDVKRSEEYAARLGGWLNRLNEIRERLKCRGCGGPLVSNMKYSSNLAIFNATVFSCKMNGIDHDKNIYISHCWACGKVIDSRVDSVKDKDNFYLCLQCGSGSKRNDGVQGKLCPKCGDSRMYISKFKLNNMYCPKCKHEINPPHKSL